MTLWTVSVLLAAVVTIVVAILLWRILHRARAIAATAGSIWQGGTRIANNTIHVPDLARTNMFAERILALTPDLQTRLERVRRHCADCPGCPACVAEGVL